MPQHPEHWLYDRGLLAAQEARDKADVEKAPQYVDATLPPDYVARVVALEAALRWTVTMTGRFPSTKEQTLQRALDFHSFLMGRETKEPVHTDD